MAHKNRNWPDLVARLSGWITGFIAFVTAVVGFAKLWQGDTGLVTIVLLAVGVGGGTLGCIYLAFKRTPPLVEGGKGSWQYPRWRPWALASFVTIPLLMASGVGYHLYQQAQPPNKVILLVADFDGPEAKTYRVTDAVWEKLSLALKTYDDVQVERLERAFVKSSDACAEGKKHRATIVIWGWYGRPAETVPMSVHFEVLRPPEYMPKLEAEVKGQVQTMAVAELERFTLQTRLSEELAYLSLFTVGMARFAAKNWEGAIEGFSHALGQTLEPVSALDKSRVYLYRGLAYGHRGDYDRAIADFDQTIKRRPDLAEAYYYRGNAYTRQGEREKAIADFEKVLGLTDDPDLRQQTEEQLEALGQSN